MTNNLGRKEQNAMIGSLHADKFLFFFKKDDKFGKSRAPSRYLGPPTLLWDFSTKRNVFLFFQTCLLVVVPTCHTSQLVTLDLFFWIRHP